MKTRPRRAHGYIRVSTQRQADEGISMPNQEAQLRAYCLRNDCELVEVHSDAGYSATNDNRPGLQGMFAEAMRPGSGITEIVVYSFSRLFRDNYLLEHYRRKLKRAGVKLIAITQEVGEDAEGDLVRGVLSKFDEYQSAQTGKCTRDSMLRNAAAGFWNGSIAPFGYQTEIVEMRGDKAKKKLAVHPVESAIVIDIYSMKRFGNGRGPMGYKKIVTHLNASGVTMRGRKFNISSVRGLLTRTTYRGEYRYGLWDTRNKVRRSADECQIITVPAIIPDDEWHEVQLGIANNARHMTPARTVSTPTMLAGIAKCGHSECGNALTIATGKGGRYRYYRCSRRLRRGETVCEGVSVRDNALETIVVDALEQRLLSPERLRALLAKMLDRSETVTQALRDRAQALRTERTNVDGKIRNMIGYIEADKASADDRDFVDRLAVNRARRNQLDQEIKQVEQQMSMDRREVTPEAVARLGEVIATKLRAPDPYVRQGYARRFIEKVVVTPDTITITGQNRPFEMAALNGPDNVGPMVPSIAREWCRLGDSNT
jgi:site-specific DNA recombinase